MESANFAPFPASLTIQYFLGYLSIPLSTDGDLIFSFTCQVESNKVKAKIFTVFVVGTATQRDILPHLYTMNRARRWKTTITLFYDLYHGLAIFNFTRNTYFLVLKVNRVSTNTQCYLVHQFICSFRQLVTLFNFTQDRQHNQSGCMARRLLMRMMSRCVPKLFLGVLALQKKQHDNSYGWCDHTLIL